MAEAILVTEQTAVQYQATLKDQAGAAVAAASLSALTLTLYDAKTGGVINSRSAQDVKNANGGTVHATSGLFTMVFAPADSPIVTATEAEEHHVAVFEAAWTGGGAKWTVDLWVRNLTLSPAAEPDLVDHALLTLPEARATLNLTKADENARLARLVNAISDDLEAWTARRLKTRTYTGLQLRVRREDVDATGAWFGLEWPITAVASVAVEDVAQTIWMPGDAGAPELKDVYLLEGDGPKHGRRSLYRTIGWCPGARVTITYTAGYGATGFLIPSELKDLAQALLRERYYAETRQSDSVASRSGPESVTYPVSPAPGVSGRLLRTVNTYKRWAA